MFNVNDNRQKSPQTRFLFILKGMVVLAFVVIGLAVIFFNDRLNIDPERLPDHWRIAFGVLVIVYGIFRASRLLNKENVR